MFFENSVLVSFGDNQILTETFDFSQVRLPPSKTSGKSKFVVGDEVELFVQIDGKRPLGWWHGVIKRKVDDGIYEVEIFFGEGCTLYCLPENLRHNNTNLPINSNTFFKLEIDVPENARESAMMNDAHKNFQKEINADICHYEPERGVLTVISRFKKTKKLANTLKALHFINLSQMEKKDLPLAESTIRQVNTQFEEACLKLEDILKCPICLDYLEPPVAQCVRGHGVCAQCKGQMCLLCPLCREPFTSYNAIVLTQILEVLPRTCKYRREGCPAVIRAGDNHKAYCEFRPTKCIQCNKTTPLNLLMNHFHTTHKERDHQDLSAEVITNLVLTESSVTFSPFSQFNHLFWRKVGVDVEKNQFAISLLMVPKAEPSCQYCANISFKKGSLKYSSSTPVSCSSFEKELNTDVFSANITIPLETMGHFVNHNNEQLDFNLSIEEENK